MENDVKTPQNQSPQSAGSKRGFSKRFFLPLAIAVIAVGVVLLVFSNGNNKLGNKAGNSPEATISINSGAFVPSTLQLTAPTTVTWVNNDQQDHQVAAEPYPKHDSIPGFDSEVLLQQGESYSYTFKTPGTYKYNDYLNPYKLKGTIIVK